MFLHPSWPWKHVTNQSTILTAGTDGTCNVSGVDGTLLHSFSANQSQVNAICATPEYFNQCADDGFYSKSCLVVIIIICDTTLVQSFFGVLWNSERDDYLIILTNPLSKSRIPYSGLIVEIVQIRLSVVI